MKSFSHPEHQISAVPPERYGERFVDFISGVTKTKEAAQRERAEKAAAEAKAKGAIDGPPPTSIVMETAESWANRSRQDGTSEADIPSRELRAVRSPSAERGELGTTLPVLEEALESSSTGGRSGRSTEASLPPAPPLKESDRHINDRSQDQSLQRPPPTPPKDSVNGDNGDGRPPTPPKDSGYTPRHSSPPTPPKENRGLNKGKEKELPLPPMETVLRVG